MLHDNLQHNLYFTAKERSNSMTVIYYNKKVFEPDFEKNIHLLYVCKADENQTKFPTALHLHEQNLELQYIYKGRGIFRIDNQLFHADAGDLLIYNQGILHDEWADPMTGMEFFNCGLTGIHVKDLPANHLISDDISPLLHCQSIGRQIKNIFESMYEQISEERVKAESFCQYALSALMVLLRYQVSWEEKPPENKKDNFILYLKEYLDAHYLENLTLEEMAKKVHMSSSNVTHQFKKRTGFSPIQYIMQRRIGQAQSLLISTDKSITEISMSIGYDNISYFNNIFKKVAGMPPKAYRKYRVGEKQYKNLDSFHKLMTKNK